MTHDVIVVGAGPAGCVVAQRLAAAGGRVAFIGAQPRPGCEGLSARSRALLAEEGWPAGEGEPLSEGSRADKDFRKGAGGIAGPFPRRGVWAGRVVEGAEWLVEREILARVLRTLACKAGADHRPDTVTQVGRVAGQWQLKLRGGGEFAAPIMVDARGRRGAQRRGPLLLAMGQAFLRREADESAGESSTHIEAMDSGWCWWAAQGPRLWVQVVGQPRPSRRPAAWISAAAAQITALSRALEGAVPAADPVARPAHARLGSPGADTTRWLVGDAAFALDPLSGQGIYEALRGARLVATAIQSVLDGGDALSAQRFVTGRYEEAWRRGVRVAAGFYRENSQRGSFWSETAAAYEALSADADADADADAGGGRNSDLLRQDLSLVSSGG